MRDPLLYDLLNQAFARSGQSQAEVLRTLRARGYVIDKSTLSRWLSGHVQPSLPLLPALHSLPDVLEMSPAEQSAFHHRLWRPARPITTLPARWRVHGV
jgi:transcriptional regulator with XRE-family HTH domain